MYANDNVRKCMRVYMGQVNLYKMMKIRELVFLINLEKNLNLLENRIIICRMTRKIHLL